MMSPRLAAASAALFTLTGFVQSNPILAARSPTCLESSTSSTVKWDVLPPFTWYDGAEDSFSWGHFYLHNAADNVTSYCYTTSEGAYGVLSGPCQAPVVPDVWNNLRDTGRFTFDVRALEVTVSQNWTCAGGDGEKGTAFTGMASWRFPGKKERGWECLPIEFEGQQKCNYTLPNVLSPKVTAVQ